MIQKIESLDEMLELALALRDMPGAARQEMIRYLARTDLFFLLWFVLGRKDMWHPWLFDRCVEVNEFSDGYLDLWARDHYKSTIITYAKSMQDILSSHGEEPLPKWQGREVTIGFFSHTRAIAKAFLKQIKRDFEEQQTLRDLFPDILWKNTRNAPQWSEDDGLIVRRKTNPKEGTVEAWGLVDGMPTGKHYMIRVYDDVVTDKSVTTPDQIAKTTHAFNLSQNLADSRHPVCRMIGTRYNFNDTYRHVIQNKIAIPRLKPATDDGTASGKPVFLTQEQLNTKKKQGPFVFACQQLQNPKEDGKMGFQKKWLRFYSNAPTRTNNYIVCDPANAKKRESDFTSIWVIGLGEDGNYYVLDGVRDRLRMKERWEIILQMHRDWQPLDVGYEGYGKDTDIEFMQEQMEQISYRFNVTKLAGENKYNRINNLLIPLYEQGKFWLPHHMFKTDTSATRYDLIQVFIDEEYDPYPVGIHPDMLDAQARIKSPELNLIWPKPMKTPTSSKRSRRASGAMTV
ncbi:MAG: hypothetical protein Q8N34_03255 [Gammaproteobacteria bacterium]|nr:hypothetical protein [Gammaproteobacteria bacterium]